jgi:translation initiation factor IF-1
MAKEDNTVKLEGDIVDVMPNAMFKVKTEMGHTILAHISGKMRQNQIKIIMGDKVELECSPYDLNRGRITRRK